MQFVCSKCGHIESVATRKAHCGCGGLWNLDFQPPKFDLGEIDMHEWSQFLSLIHISITGEVQYMQQITLTSKLENRGHYVPGMISGDKLYVSGQLPVHHETGSPMADSIEPVSYTHLLRALSEGAQRRTLHFAQLAAQHGMPCQTVSYGATPTFMNHVDILPGITELRPGTYALMDASQGHAIGTLDRCAATVLATVISRPTAERTILDVGAKGLTMQSRTEGICATPGLSLIHIYRLSRGTADVPHHRYPLCSHLAARSARAEGRAAAGRAPA